MKTGNTLALIIALLLAAGTEVALAQSQQAIPRICDGEPNKADCVMLSNLCSRPGGISPDISYCMNDATYCLLHDDAELCAEIQQHRAQEDIAHSWQVCIGVAASRADADLCHNAYTACTLEYYKSRSVPSSLTKNAAGQWMNAARAAANMKYLDCIAATSKFKPLLKSEWVKFVDYCCC